MGEFGSFYRAKNQNNTNYYDESFRDHWGQNNDCKCCTGTGIQRRNDGIYINCPCCNGTGIRQTSHIRPIWKYDPKRLPIVTCESKRCKYE
jgi:hypothetical protein